MGLARGEQPFGGLNRELLAAVSAGVVEGSIGAQSDANGSDVSSKVFTVKVRKQSIGFCLPVLSRKSEFPRRGLGSGALESVESVV